MKTKVTVVLLVVLLTVAGVVFYSKPQTPAPTVFKVEIPATSSAPIASVPAAKSPTVKQGSSSSTQVVSKPTPVSLPSQDITVANVIIAMNNDRIANGLQPLRESSQLDSAAQAKATDEATRGYFSHTNPEGGAVWALILQSGYEYRHAGENLAVLFNTVSEEEIEWMKSPTHRENILKPQYKDVGVGIAVGTWNGQTTKFVVMLFGAK